MRGVMSLWTKTPMFVPTRGPMLIQTLSANLAARVFTETEFVTDVRGAAIAKLLGWPLNGTATSMVVEQYQLGVFARRVGVEVGTLLPLAPSRKQVAKAGYAHLTGGAKREDKWIAKAEAGLAADFPEAYERFSAAWPQLAPPGQGGAAAPDLQTALKARKLLAEIEEHELRLAVKRGEFMPVEQVCAE
jgi:hypothetical protein